MSKQTIRELAAATLAAAIHGPAEALPISSSAHVAIVNRLFAGADASCVAKAGCTDQAAFEHSANQTTSAEAAAQASSKAKTIEVAAHAGTLLGLTIGLRGDLKDALWSAASEPATSLKTVFNIGVATLPAVAAAVTLEKPIERRLGGNRAIASGLLLGAVAMIAADRHDSDGRDWRKATPKDAIKIGCAQASALWPGVSRSGAVLAASRACGFSRAASGKTSAALAGPVVGGATLLKLVRLGSEIKNGRLDSSSAQVFTAVSLVSALSGWLAAPLARWTLNGIALWPFSIYRIVLAGLLACNLPPNTPRNLQRSFNA